jgi:TonB family protein
LFGLARLRRLAARAETLSTGAWVRHAEDIRRVYGLRPVTLLSTDCSTLLVTWGVAHPKVLLPADAARWSDDRIRVVLLHELAHVARGDWIVQLAAELIRSVYWFNPLLWIACRRLRHESERACDDAVLNRGVAGAEYATHLVNIARELRRRPAWVPAPAIARTSSLEGRVRVMLDAGVNRQPLSRSACLATLLALLAFAGPVSAVAVSQAVFATVSGSIVDPMDGVLAGATVMLTNEQTKAKYEVRSDQTGRYEFAGVAAGEYLFDVEMPGFARHRSKLSVAGQAMQRDLTLQVGSLEETVQVREKAGRAVPASTPGGAISRLPKINAADCRTTATANGAFVGGSLRPPRKLLHANPHYPADLVSSGVEGSVVLQARIGTDGAIADVTVVSSPHADLANAALEAVRQWEFDPTLLNCVPIEVNMKVTVNFERER